MPNTAFNEYVAALSDDETVLAAEIYANNSGNPEFFKLTEVFHALLTGFRDGAADAIDAISNASGLSPEEVKRKLDSIEEFGDSWDGC